MKYKVSLKYSGIIDMEVNAPDPDAAEQVALDDIDQWPEALFIERLDLGLESVDFEVL